MNIFYPYVQCNICNTQYCPLYLAEEELDKLYSEMDDNLAGEDLSAAAATQRGYLRHVEGYGLPRGVWVDIGADIGLLAHALGENSRVEKVIAVEPNVKVRAELQARLRPNDEIFDNLNHLPKEAPVQGVIGVHVLDHVLSPRSFLGAISESLDDRGVVAFVTHSHGSFLRRLLRHRWAPYCLQHPQIYDSSSLTYLLSSCGFTDIRVRRTVNHISIRKILRVGLSIIGLPTRIEKFVPNFVLKVPLGNVIVVGRKMTSLA